MHINSWLACSTKLGEGCERGNSAGSYPGLDGVPNGGSATDAGGRSGQGGPSWGHARGPEGPGWGTWGQERRAGLSQDEAQKKRGGTDQRKWLKGRLGNLQKKAGAISGSVSRIILKNYNSMLQQAVMSRHRS